MATSSLDKSLVWLLLTALACTHRPGLYIMAYSGHLVACPGHLLACPGHLVACPGNLVARPGHLVACPGHLVACPGNLVACPGHLVACPGQKVGCQGCHNVCGGEEAGRCITVHRSQCLACGRENYQPFYSSRHSSKCYREWLMFEKSQTEFYYPYFHHIKDFPAKQ